MRKIIISLLLASTAVTPALAAGPRDRDERASQREERKADRSEAREERQSDRSQAREERQAERLDARQANRNERAEQRSNAADARADARAAGRADQRDVQAIRDARRDGIANRQADRQQAREDRLDRQQQAREDRQETRTNWQQQANRARERVRIPTGARPDRPAPPPATATRSPTTKWHSNWRNDNRYDWRRWRDRNRSIFHLGFYFDPFGWNYRRYNVGWRLWPSYYSSNYWLDDPYQYRLPYAPWPYKWVRYYDDALLVNTMTGQVDDVLYDFFW